MKVAIRAGNILRRHPHTRIGGSGLASDLRLSRFQLYRRVKAHAGKSPKKLAGEHRIERACRLLEKTGKTVGEIAAVSGLPDTNYFIRFFKKRTGLTPGAWRRRHAPARAVTARRASSKPKQVVKKVAPPEPGVLPVHLL